MTQPGRRPFECRCGRTTHRPEVVNGLLLCPECAFDEQYGPARVTKLPVRPPFEVRRVG